MGIRPCRKLAAVCRIILYSLSRLIRDRFAAVASKYGTLSLAQSVSNIKQVVRNSFITNIHF